MLRSCKNQAYNFCYICGELTLKRCRRSLTPHVKKLYELYFGCKLSDQEKNWVPHVCCVRFTSSLSSWKNRTGGGPTFGVPMVWREPQNHCTDCYFFSVDISGLDSKSKRAIVYPNLPLAIRPVPHSVDPSSFLNLHLKSQTQPVLIQMRILMMKVKSCQKMQTVNPTS
jgi:hypothetical protein